MEGHDADGVVVEGVGFVEGGPGGEGDAVGGEFMLPGFVGEQGDLGAGVVLQEAGQDRLEGFEEAIVGGQACPADDEFLWFVGGGGADLVA